MRIQASCGVKTSADSEGEKQAQLTCLPRVSLIKEHKETTKPEEPCLQTCQ